MSQTNTHSLMINLISIVAVKLDLALIIPFLDLLAMQRGEDWDSNKMLIIFNECELCSSFNVAVADQPSVTLLMRPSKVKSKDK